MKRILMSLTMLVALGSVMLVQAAALSAEAKHSSPTVQATGIPINFQSALGTFDGFFNITKFVVQNGTLNAVGNLTGTVRDATGAIVGNVNQSLTLPVLLPQTTGSCEILDLVLGPLDLNLLGLQVHLDTVHLNITAQSGPGQLLGNLLCAVANLLNNGGPLQGLAALLNNLLRAL